MGLYDNVSSITVDLTSFDGLVRQLEQIRGYLQNDLLKTRMSQLTQAERGQSSSTPPTGSGSVFGDFDEARALSARIGSARTQVQQELTQLERRVEALLAATRQVQTNYRSLEEKNQADARQIQLLLDAPSTPSPGAPAGAASATLPGSPVGAASTTPPA